MPARVMSLLPTKPETGFHRRASEPPAEGARSRHMVHGPLLTFAIVNLAGVSLVAAAWFQGWTDLALAGDRTGLTLAIVATFVAGLAVAAFRLFRLSCEIACARTCNPCARSWAGTYLAEVEGRGAASRAISGSALRVRVAGSIAAVRHIAASLVILGLIGTVVGFIIAMSGVDPEAARNVDAVSPMVGELISGMSVALYTTLLGAALNLWLMINYHLLGRAAERLVLDLVALGESRART